MNKIQPVEIDEPKTPLLAIIGNNPRLVDLYRQLTTILVRESSLEPRCRWLITMRMASLSNCGYEFGRHAAHALDPADLVIARMALDDERLSDEDRLLLTFVEDVYKNQNVGDDLWNKIQDQYEISEIIEMITLLGLYFMAGTIANIAGLGVSKG